MSLLSFIAVFAMPLSILIALFLKLVFTAIYIDPSTLPNSSHTYIIVGGMSERPRISSAY